MESTTKQRILEEALVMFGENGYKGTNLRELAQRLGLSKSALYRHFESKEDIWNCLYEKMESRYGESFGSEENMPPVPNSTYELVATTMKMVDFTVHDRYVVLMRKLIASEQFRDERITPMATKHFLTDIGDIFTHVFRGMMQNGIMKEYNPKLLALEYTAPITELIHLCDREPEKTEEVMGYIQDYVEHFVSVYCVDNKS